jgi:hypothetical protein
VTKEKDDLGALCRALVAPTDGYRNGKDVYESLRGDLIEEYGYEGFVELQKRAFKVVLYGPERTT